LSAFGGLGIESADDKILRKIKELKDETVKGFDKVIDEI
jgi:hypothetical protein